MARVGCTGVHSHTHQLILPAVVLLWHLLIFILRYFSCGTALVFILITSRFLVETVFFPHDLIERVRLQVEVSGEFKQIVDLVISESIEVEDDTLKVHNQNVRGGRQQYSL